MDENYETFEEELPPQRLNRPIRRPETYAARKLKEEMASVPLQIKAEPKIPARETSFSKSTSLPPTVSTQNASQPEVPWESVTLNRCLFIAITILVLTSGYQRLHEALHGHKVMPDEEEDQYGIILRSRALRHRTEPEVTLWDTILSWLPDLDDDDDEDDEDDDEVRKVKKRKPKRPVKSLRGLRNRPISDKLLKQRDSQSEFREDKETVDHDVNVGENDPEDNVETVKKTRASRGGKIKKTEKLLD